MIVERGSVSLAEIAIEFFVVFVVKSMQQHFVYLFLIQ